VGKKVGGLVLQVGTVLGSGKDVLLSGTNLMAHKIIIGITGSGKSKLLASIIVQLINLGWSVILLDPHSDLCDDILCFLHDTGYFVNQQAFSRVRYLDFSGKNGHYPAFNVLRQKGQSVSQVARWVWTAMSRAWSGIDGGQAPMMEQVMLSGTLALASAGYPLTAMNKLFTDSLFRCEVLAHVKDSQVREFFERIEASGKRSGAISESALRRAYLLSFTPELRYSLGASENLLDLRAAMDQGVTLLCDLGGLDEESQRLLGCLITVGSETAALSRADIREEARKPAFLVLDEWSMFAAESEVALERMLALVRKYGLSVTLACQTLGQTRKLQSALQNCIPIVLRLGGIDSAWGAARVSVFDPKRLKTTASGSASYMSRGEQEAEFADRLERLPSRHAFTRLSDQAIPFYTLGLPSPRCSHRELEQIKAEYARRWLRPAPEEGEREGEPEAQDEQITSDEEGPPLGRTRQRISFFDPENDV
jgi:hypothetical protein